MALASSKNPLVGASILQGAAAGTAERQAREQGLKQQEFENRIKQQTADAATAKAAAALDADQSKQLDAIPDGASGLAYLKSIDPRDTKGLQDEFLNADGSVKQFNPFSKDASRIEMLQKRYEAQDATLRKKLGDQVVDNFWKDTLPYSQDPEGQKKVAALYDKQNNTTDFSEMLGAGTGASDKSANATAHLDLEQQKVNELISNDELKTLKGIGDLPPGFEQRQAVMGWNRTHPSEKLPVPDGKNVPYYQQGETEKALAAERTAAAQLSGVKSKYYPQYVQALIGKDKADTFLANQKALVVAPLAQDKINNTAIRGAYDDALIRLGEGRNENAQQRMNVLMRDANYRELNTQDISLRSHILTLQSQLMAAPINIKDEDTLKTVQDALGAQLKDLGGKQADVESQLRQIEAATPSVTPAPYSPDAPDESGNGPRTAPSVMQGIKQPTIPSGPTATPAASSPPQMPRSSAGIALKMIGMRANTNGEPACADGVCLIAKRVGLPVPQTSLAKVFEDKLPSSGWGQIPLSQAGPNDIITSKGSGLTGRHVQWSIGNGQVIEADSKADNYSNRLVKGRVPTNDPSARAWRYNGGAGAPPATASAAPVVSPPSGASAAGGRPNYHAMSNSDLMAAFLRLGQKYITKR